MTGIQASRPPDIIRAMKLSMCDLMLVTGTAAALASLSGCTTGNERSFLGNDRSGNVAAMPEFVGKGEAPPPSSSGVSLVSLSRANWSPTYVVVPIDGLAQKPTYTTTHVWSQDTARARGQMPTVATALELEGNKRWAQVGEAATSPLYATWDAVTMITWDMWVDCPGQESIRPPMAHQRTTPDTLRAVPLDNPAGAAQ